MASNSFNENSHFLQRNALRLSTVLFGHLWVQRTQKLFYCVGHSAPHPTVRSIRITCTVLYFWFFFDMCVFPCATKFTFSIVFDCFPLMHFNGNIILHVHSYNTVYANFIHVFAVLYNNNPILSNIFDNLEISSFLFSTFLLIYNPSL